MDRRQISKENNYFSKDLEKMSRKDIQILQYEETKETLERDYYQSVFARIFLTRLK
jgi:hypothetical protein